MNLRQSINCNLYQEEEKLFKSRPFLYLKGKKSGGFLSVYTYCSNLQQHTTQYREDPNKASALNCISNPQENNSDVHYYPSTI